MNNILYALIGGGVAIAIVMQFFGGQKHQIGEIDLAVTALFVAALAGLAFVLMNTRWGRRWRWRAKRKQIDQDVQVWTDARTKGHVRRPPVGPI
jgi:hypothetical protein